jgi:hypothetical protein
MRRAAPLHRIARQLQRTLDVIALRSSQRDQIRVQTGTVGKRPENAQGVRSPSGPVVSEAALPHGGWRDNAVKFDCVSQLLVSVWIDERRHIIGLRLTSDWRTLTSHRMQSRQKGIVTDPSGNGTKPAQEVDGRGDLRARESTKSLEVDTDASQLALRVEWVIAWVLGHALRGNHR